MKEKINYKSYIMYFITGLLISLLTLFTFITLKNAASFMFGVLIGWQVYKTIQKLKAAQGALTILKIRHLMFAAINIGVGAFGFVLGIGLLKIIN